jgi:hypothetical protein
MIRGTNIWKKEELVFTTPEGCEAVVVRLRRNPSRRLDAKIEGDLWLDDFRLEKTPATDSLAGRALPDG